MRSPPPSSQPACRCPAVPQVAQLPPYRCPAPPTSSALGPEYAQVPLSSASPSGAWFLWVVSHQGGGKATIRVWKTKLLLQTVPRRGGGGTAQHLSLHLLPVVSLEGIAALLMCTKLFEAPALRFLQAERRAGRLAGGRQAGGWSLCTALLGCRLSRISRPGAGSEPFPEEAGHTDSLLG